MLTDEQRTAIDTLIDKPGLVMAGPGLLIAVRDELVRLTAKCNNSLANNLCPDHRDKQSGKPCLACSIEKLTAENAKLRECVSYADSWLKAGGREHWAELKRKAGV